MTKFTDKAHITGAIQVLLPDNLQADISPLDSRTSFQHVIDSLALQSFATDAEALDVTLTTKLFNPMNHIRFLNEQVYGTAIGNTLAQTQTNLGVGFRTLVEIKASIQNINLTDIVLRIAPRDASKDLDFVAIGIASSRIIGIIGSRFHILATGANGNWAAIDRQTLLREPNHDITLFPITVTMTAVDVLNDDYIFFIANGTETIYRQQVGASSSTILTRNSGAGIYQGLAIIKDRLYRGIRTDNSVDIEVYAVSTSGVLSVATVDMIPHEELTRLGVSRTNELFEMNGLLGIIDNTTDRIIFWDVENSRAIPPEVLSIDTSRYGSNNPHSGVSDGKHLYIVDTQDNFGYAYDMRMFSHVAVPLVQYTQDAVPTIDPFGGAGARDLSLDLNSVLLITGGITVPISTFIIGDHAFVKQHNLAPLRAFNTQTGAYELSADITLTNASGIYDVIVTDDFYIASSDIGNGMIVVWDRSGNYLTANSEVGNQTNYEGYAFINFVLYRTAKNSGGESVLQAFRVNPSNGVTINSEPHNVDAADLAVLNLGVVTGLLEINGLIGFIDVTAGQVKLWDVENRRPASETPIIILPAAIQDPVDGASDGRKMFILDRADNHMYGFDISAINKETISIIDHVNQKIAAGGGGGGSGIANTVNAFWQPSDWTNNTTNLIHYLSLDVGADNFHTLRIGLPYAGNYPIQVNRDSTTGSTEIYLAQDVQVAGKLRLGGPLEHTDGTNDYELVDMDGFFNPDRLQNIPQSAIISVSGNQVLGGSSLWQASGWTLSVFGSGDNIAVGTGNNSSSGTINIRGSDGLSTTGGLYVSILQSRRINTTESYYAANTAITEGAFLLGGRLKLGSVANDAIIGMTGNKVSGLNMWIPSGWGAAGVFRVQAGELTIDELTADGRIDLLDKSGANTAALKLGILTAQKVVSEKFFIGVAGDTLTELTASGVLFLEKHKALRMEKRTELSVLLNNTTQFEYISEHAGHFFGLSMTPTPAEILSFNTLHSPQDGTTAIDASTQTTNLVTANSSPRGVGVTATEYWVPDNSGEKVYNYLRASGRHQSAKDIQLPAGSSPINIAIRADGKIFILLSTQDVLAYNADGTPDTTADVNIHTLTDYPPRSIAFSIDRMIIAGYATGQPVRIYFLPSDATSDSQIIDRETGYLNHDIRSAEITATNELLVVQNSNAVIDYHNLTSAKGGALMPFLTGNTQQVSRPIVYKTGPALQSRKTYIQVFSGNMSDIPSGSNIYYVGTATSLVAKKLLDANYTSAVLHMNGGSTRTSVHVELDLELLRIARAGDGTSFLGGMDGAIGINAVSMEVTNYGSRSRTNLYYQKDAVGNLLLGSEDITATYDIKVYGVYY